MNRTIQITGLRGRDFDANDIVETSHDVAAALRNPDKGWHTECATGCAAIIRIAINENPDLYTDKDAGLSPIIDWEAGTIDAPQISLNHKITFRNIEEQADD